jgi:hypothetical protein
MDLISGPPGVCPHLSPPADQGQRRRHAALTLLCPLASGNPPLCIRGMAQGQAGLPSGTSQVKALQPKFVIENGVYAGHSTWVIRTAAPGAAVFSLDPLCGQLHCDPQAWRLWKRGNCSPSARLLLCFFPFCPPLQTVFFLGKFLAKFSNNFIRVIFKKNQQISAMMQCKFTIFVCRR